MNQEIFQGLGQYTQCNFFTNSPDTSFTETSKRVIMFSENTQMMIPQDCRPALRRLSGAGNNPMVGMTVAVAVAIEEASKYSCICKAF